MIQATGSNAGKSLFVAGLARVLHRKGLRVAPFKPQNMANNAAVAKDGGEIARAQALQCIACACEPSSDMNPVLLKPQSDGSSQLIVQGRAKGSVRARDYPQMRNRLLGKVRESYRRLAQEFEVILVEGAGSPAEVNLRAGDIANMGFALAEQIPVLMLADIERGGSIAALCGTHQLLEQQERSLVQGYIINKFRGEVALFEPAIEVISKRTGWRNAGVITWCENLNELPAEDSLDLKRDRKSSATQELSPQELSPQESARKNAKATCRVTALRCPYMANADDLDPLLLDKNFEVRLLEAGSPIPADSDVVLLLGSKSVLADLAFLRQQGWDVDLLAHRRRGGMVFGICGGYQMLGTYIEDAQGLEGARGKKLGLALLSVATAITQGKKLLRVEGIARLPSPARRATPLENKASEKTRISGYEMHNGETRVVENSKKDAATSQENNQAVVCSHSPSAVRPWLSIQELSPQRLSSQRLSTQRLSPPAARGGACQDDTDISTGVISADGYVLGCYLHGIFASSEFRRAFYQYARSSYQEPALEAIGGGWLATIDYAERIEQVLDIWADHITSCCDIEFIISLLNDGASDTL